MQSNPFGVPLALCNIAVCCYALLASTGDGCPHTWHAQWLGSALAWLDGILIVGTLAYGGANAGNWLRYQWERYWDSKEPHHE